MDHNNGYLPRSREIIESTMKYLDEQDVVINFAKAKCDIISEYKGLTPENLYRKFCEHSIGQGRYQKSFEKFSEHLKTVGYLKPTGTHTKLLLKVSRPASNIPTNPLLLNVDHFSDDELIASVENI